MLWLTGFASGAARLEDDVRAAGRSRRSLCASVRRPLRLVPAVVGRKWCVVRGVRSSFRRHRRRGNPAGL